MFIVDYENPNILFTAEECGDISRVDLRAASHDVIFRNRCRIDERRFRTLSTKALAQSRCLGPHQLIVGGAGFSIGQFDIRAPPTSTAAAGAQSGKCFVCPSACIYCRCKASPWQVHLIRVFHFIIQFTAKMSPMGNCPHYPNTHSPIPIVHMRPLSVHVSLVTVPFIQPLFPPPRPPPPPNPSPGPPDFVKLWGPHYTSHETGRSAFNNKFERTARKIHMNPRSSVSVSGLHVSTNGRTLLASFQGDQIYTFDLFGCARDEEIPQRGFERVDLGVVGPTSCLGGHINYATFLKNVAFFGPRDEYVVSGSDSGHMWIWETFSGKLKTGKMGPGKSTFLMLHNVIRFFACISMLHIKCNAHSYTHLFFMLEMIFKHPRLTLLSSWHVGGVRMMCDVVWQ